MSELLKIGKTDLSLLEFLGTSGGQVDEGEIRKNVRAVVKHGSRAHDSFNCLIELRLIMDRTRDTGAGVVKMYQITSKGHRVLRLIHQLQKELSSLDSQ